VRPPRAVAAVLLREQSLIMDVGQIELSHAWCVTVHASDFISDVAVYAGRGILLLRDMQSHIQDVTGSDCYVMSEKVDIKLIV
jgi:hypothetical protein